MDLHHLVDRLSPGLAARTGWTVRRILKRLGFPKSRYYDWRQRADEQLLADLFPGARRCPHAILAEEKEAVIEYSIVPVEELSTAPLNCDRM